MNHEITVYYHPFSNCSQRLLLLFEEKRLNYKKVKINLLTNQQLKPDFLAINPKGRVPAIEYQGKFYNESCDIMYLLENLFPETCFIPADINQRNVMQQFVQAAKDSHDAVKDYVYSCNIGRLPTDAELALYDRIDPENADFHHRRRAGTVGNDIDKAGQRVWAFYNPIEEQLAQQDWIATEFSLADMACFPNTIIFRQCGYDFSAMPNVTDWIKRMEQRASYAPAFGDEIDHVPQWLFRRAMKLKRLLQPNRS